MQARPVLMLACAALMVASGLWARAVHAAPAADAPPWLGVLIGDGLRGVRIIEVIPGTPADDAGIAAGDEILMVAGTRVQSFVALQTAISGHRVADRIELGVWRDGAMSTVAVVLGPKLDDSDILQRRLAGKIAPDFDMPIAGSTRSRGQISSLRALGGRVVVIQFFSTQCEECTRMHPRLSRLVDEHGRDGIEVLAVSQETGPVLDAWVKRTVPSFTVARDPYGEMFRSYRVDRLPSVVVVCSSGEVCFAGIGAGALDDAVFAAKRALGDRRAR